MPSKHMTRMPIDLYPHQVDILNNVIKDNNVKKARFLRECLNHIITSPIETKKVINKCRSTNYVKVKQ